ncbi:MAG TPA: class II aldolase/adducin family protein [Candidatus Binatia bacterium]|nr:class II aldolase/adducin family protein [Candidatus Binatia bacterium]
MAVATRHPGVELVLCAQALARASLVDAFGHVSMRTEAGLLITPPVPPGSLTSDAELREVSLDTSELPPGVPLEAWIHVAVLRARPDVGAVCRAQPPVATALAAAGAAIWPLHGQGAFCGAEVPVWDDAVLVRDERRATALAAALGPAPALVLRGNGAVTIGSGPGQAVALMWVLEASARINRDALAARGAAGKPHERSCAQVVQMQGSDEQRRERTPVRDRVAQELTPQMRRMGVRDPGGLSGCVPSSRRPLRDDEQAAWRAAAPELLGRIWSYLREDAKEW